MHVAASAGFSYNWIPLIFTQKKIQGSIVLGSARTNVMLELAHANKEFMLDDDAGWSTQEINFSQINEAMDQVR